MPTSLQTAREILDRLLLPESLLQFAVIGGAILLVGGYDGPNVWTVVILYFTIFHSMLVLLGILGLAKALAGQCWRYPLVGRPLPAGCRRG